MNLRGIDLNLLTVFEAVYEERSQVRASERLFMTQPAVSHAVSRLRFMFNDRLFEGRSLGLVPTGKATALYPEVHAILDRVRQQLISEAPFDPLHCARTFTLAVSFSGGLILAPRLHRAFKVLAPLARLVLRTIDPRDEIQTLLRRQEIDLVFHFGRFEAPDLEEVTLFEDPLVILARENHPRIQGAPTVESCLQEQFVVAFRLLETVRDQAFNTFLADVRERTVLEVGNTLVAANTVRQTDLLGITNRLMAGACREIFPLACFPLPVAHPALRAQLTWHSGMSDDAAHRWFRERVRDVFSNDFPGLMALESAQED